MLNKSSAEFTQLGRKAKFQMDRTQVKRQDYLPVGISLSSCREQAKLPVTTTNFGPAKIMPSFSHTNLTFVNLN